MDMEQTIAKKIIKEGLLLNQDVLSNYILSGKDIFDLNLTSKEFYYLLIDYLKIIKNGRLYYAIASNTKNMANIYKILEKTPYPYNLYFSICIGYSSDVVPSTNVKFSDTNLDCIYAVLDTLSEREQQILLLRFRDDYSYADIAKRYNISTNRLRQVTAKALRKLRHPSRLKRLYGPKSIVDLGLDKNIEEVLLNNNITNLDELYHILDNPKKLKYVTGFTVEMLIRINENKLIDREYELSILDEYRLFGSLELVYKEQDISDEDQEMLMQYVRNYTRSYNYGPKYMRAFIDRYGSDKINTFIEAYKNQLAENEKKMQSDVERRTKRRRDFIAGIQVDNARKVFEVKYTEYLELLKNYQQKEWDKTKEHFESVRDIKEAGLIPKSEELTILASQMDMIAKATNQINLRMKQL